MSHLQTKRDDAPGTTGTTATEEDDISVISKGLQVGEYSEENGLGYGDDNSDDNSDCDFEKSCTETTARQSKTDDSEDEEDAHKMFAKKENEAVLRLRLLVFDFLIVATIGISLIVYVTTTRKENAEYEKQFESASKKVLDTFMDIAHTKLAAITSLAVALAIEEEESGSKWPFVTLKRFQERASNIMTQSGALYVNVNPQVTKDQRNDWEDFVTGNESYWM